MVEDQVGAHAREADHRHAGQLGDHAQEVVDAILAVAHHDQRLGTGLRQAREVDQGDPDRRAVGTAALDIQGCQPGAGGIHHLGEEAVAMPPLPRAVGAGVAFALRDVRAAGRG